VGPLAEYEELAARVTAPGVVWRAGVDRGLAHAQAVAALSPRPGPDRSGDDPNG
jgi:hypothetical protein